MKNLENYGVQEMDIGECKEVDGGFILAAFATMYAYNAVIAAIENPQGVLDGFLDCFE